MLLPDHRAELADGIGPSVALRQAGATITLGSDSNTVIDGFAEARALAMHERLASGRRDGWDADQLWAAASAGGHASLGFADAGTLRREAHSSVQTGWGERALWAAGPLRCCAVGLEPDEVAADLTSVIDELWSRV